MSRLRFGLASPGLSNAFGSKRDYENQSLLDELFSVTRMFIGIALSAQAADRMRAGQWVGTTIVDGKTTRHRAVYRRATQQG